MGLSSMQASADNNLEYWSQVGDHLDVPKQTTTATNESKNKQIQLQCPRCDSSNTKFCYYNNYSRLQPRHFCRACKRHWTAGGTLRNVPVGGGSRKSHKRVAKHNHHHIVDEGSKVEQQIKRITDSAAIFPDVFGQVMFQPQFCTQMLLLPDSDVNIDAENSSTPRFFKGAERQIGSSSDGSEEIGVLNLMDGWVTNANYDWNCWDGITDGV